jgi:hypothetical protein
MKARGGNLFEIGFMMASLSDMLMEFMRKELSDLQKNQPNSQVPHSIQHISKSKP